MIKDLVSIIMPSWNTSEYIGQSIQSIIDQTYKNWELIIVDDCSTDCTNKVVGEFNDSRIKYFKNNENIGAALTRNKALRMAKGEWIAFLDSDDLWNPLKLEKQLKFMIENNIYFSYHNYEKIDENSKPIGILVTGPKIVTQRKMYNYGYPGCLTFMYSAKRMGMVKKKNLKQIKNS